jgi:hypothetical protein
MIETQLEEKRVLNGDAEAIRNYGHIRATHARNAREFLRNWLINQMSQGKSLQNFRSPAGHIIEDELMASVYWYVVSWIDPADTDSNTASVSDPFPLTQGIASCISGFPNAISLMRTSLTCPDVQLL